MSDGKRYKEDGDIKLDQEQLELQKKYKAMLEEIKNKENVQNLEEVQDVKEQKNLELDTKEDIEIKPKKTIAELKMEKEKEKIVNETSEIKEESKITPLILDDFEIDSEKIEKELNDNEKKMEELKLRIEELEKEQAAKTEELFPLITKEEKEEEIDEEVEIEEKEKVEEIAETIQTAEKPKKKGSKFFKFIGNLIYYTVFLFVLLVLALVAVQRFSDNEIALGGYRMFNIITESMEPDYMVGDVLISKEIEPEDIKIGDDVVYKGKERPFKDMIVTHRVIDLNLEEDGTYSFLTKGIANDVDDPIISEDQVFGKIIYKVQSFSILSKAINNMYVFFFVIFIPVVLLVSIKIIQVRHERKEDKESN